MKIVEVSRVLALTLFVSFLPISCSAIPVAATSCEEVKLRYRIASAKDEDAIRSLHLSPDSSGSVGLFVAIKKFELSAKNGAANLLDHMPLSPEAVDLWLALETSSCGAVTDEELGVITRLNQKLPGYLALAAIESPGRMKSYLQFTLVSSSIANESHRQPLAMVCRKAEKAFLRGISELSPEERTTFTNEILDVKNCRPID